MEQKEIDWKDFEMSIELHKYNLDFIMKLNMFYYAITGAILSFHFTKESPSVSIMGLLLPIVLSLTLGGFLLYGAKLAMNLRTNIRERGKALGLKSYPEGIVLVLTCIIFGSIMVLVGLILLGYIFYR